jgi:hypothetical protein
MTIIDFMRSHPLVVSVLNMICVGFLLYCIWMVWHSPRWDDYPAAVNYGFVTLLSVLVAVNLACAWCNWSSFWKA